MYIFDSSQTRISGILLDWDIWCWMRLKKILRSCSEIKFCWLVWEVWKNQIKSKTANWSNFRNPKQTVWFSQCHFATKGVKDSLKKSFNINISAGDRWTTVPLLFKFQFIHLAFSPINEKICFWFLYVVWIFLLLTAQWYWISLDTLNGFYTNWWHMSLAIWSTLCQHTRIFIAV